MKKRICWKCYYYDKYKCSNIMNSVEGKAGRKWPWGHCNRWLSADVMREFIKGIEEKLINPLTAWAESFLLKFDHINKDISNKFAKIGEKK